MAICVRNIHTKKYENVMIFVQVIIKNVRDVFFLRQCVVAINTVNPPARQSPANV